MRTQFAAHMVHRLHRRAGQFELAPGLKRNGAAAGDVIEADDVALFHDRLPAEQKLHPFQQCLDAARLLIGDRIVAAVSEGKFFVLGADTELCLRLAAFREPGDEFVARLDRPHVDLVASHAGSRAGRAAN
jgi:hypothetical protein